MLSQNASRCQVRQNFLNHMLTSKGRRREVFLPFKGKLHSQIKAVLLLALVVVQTSSFFSRLALVMTLNS